jgi:hypothetical protein
LQPVEGLWRQFADLGAFEAHAIEAGEPGPEEVARLLAERLEAGQLAA